MFTKVNIIVCENAKGAEKKDVITITSARGAKRERKSFPITQGREKYDEKSFPHSTESCYRSHNNITISFFSSPASHDTTTPPTDEYRECKSIKGRFQVSVSQLHLLCAVLKISV